jgi:hypothetical protein
MGGEGKEGVVETLVDGKKVMGAERETEEWGEGEREGKR